MSSNPAPQPSPSPIQKHPPERRQRKKDGIVLYSCCCCCCCCLHTLGGVIGAALGGGYTPEPDYSVKPPRRLPSSTFLYWMSFLIAVLFVSGALVALYPSMVRPEYDPVEVVLGLGFILLLAGPLYLLAGVVVMAFWIGLSPELRERPEYWRSLGGITLRIVLGTVIGILVMVGLFILCSIR